MTSAVIIFFALLFSTQAATAQDKFEVSLEAELVSRYIWRGIDLESGASIQPSITLGWKGFYLSAWGNTSITPFDLNEVDITLGYNIGNFTVEVTDYWWDDGDAKFGDYKNDHSFDVNFSYYISEKIPLTLSTAVMFYGDSNPETEKNKISAYFNAAYDINCPYGIVLTASIGATTKSFNYIDRSVRGITDIALKATKEIKVGRNYSIPIYTQAIFSPVVDKAYLILGVIF